MNASLMNDVLSDEVRRRIAAPTESGTGLPNACYTSEAWLALERERVFARTWTLAGLAHDIPRPGDACPVDVAGMPILLLRDDDGAIRAYHNVCRHRGAVLVDKPCTGKKILTCPYHGWAYGLDGRLRTRPHFNGPGQHDVLPPGSNISGLAPVRHAQWHDLIFVDISGKAPPFEQHWAPFAKRMGAYDFGALRFAKTLTFDVKGNWKLIHENFFDPYHPPVVHPRLEVFAPITLRHETRSEGAWLYNTNPIAEPQDGRGLGMPYYPGLDAEGLRTEWYFHLFPTIDLEIWPDQLAVFQLQPIAPNRTLEMIHLYFIGDAATDPRYAGQRQSVYDMWNELNTEDFEIVENMHQARCSPGFDGGVLSPYWDQATQWFARMMLETVK